MIRILNIYAAILILLLSCSTSRRSVQTVVKYDSTAVRSYDSLLQIKRSDSAAYTAMIESLSQNTIIFQDTGTTRVEYYPDGSLKVVEGRVRSLGSALSKSEKVAAYWQSRYDSLARSSGTDSVRLVREQMVITKNRRSTVLPWWIWLIVIPGLLAGYFIKKKAG